MEFPLLFGGRTRTLRLERVYCHASDEQLSASRQPVDDTATTMSLAIGNRRQTIIAASTAALLIAAVSLLHAGRWFQVWDWLTYNAFLRHEAQPAPGVETIAQMLQGLHSGRTVQPLDIYLQLTIDICLVMVVGLLSIRLVSGGLRLVALALISAPLLISLLLFLMFQRWFEPLPAMLTLALAYPIWQWQDHRRLTGSIQHERQRAAVTLQTLAEAVITVNAENRIAYLNPAAETLTGWTASEAVGKHCEQVLNAREESRRRTLCDSLSGANIDDLAKYWTLSLRSGERKIIRASFAHLDESRGSRDIVITLSDVTPERKLNEKIHYQATHDPLTRLPNRALLHDRLLQAILRIQRTGKYLAVLVTDLDDFKKVNDSLGHAAGDALLCTIAGRLIDCVGHEDTVGRRGGDEFVVILENLQDRESAFSIAENLAGAARKPQLILGHELFVTTSVGISLFPKDGETPEDLLRNADIAMYRAKNSGGNCAVAFEQAMNDSAMERFTLDNDLQRALSQQEFRLLYQPIIDMASGSVVGVEALIRWQHPKRGLLTPDTFIASAEKNGLIVPIGEWVINQACADLANWLPDRQCQFRVAVNISPRQLQDPGLADMITGTLQKYGLDPDYLELEITEEVLMSDTCGDLTSLCRLRELGLKIAIDDFGTGYSSFSYLKRVNVNRLKIDRSFVQDLSAGSRDAAIVQTIISLARLLQLDLTAEGIESTEQAFFFKQQGRIESQGFYFAGPMAPEKIGQMMTGSAPAGYDSKNLRFLKRSSQ